jgi:hypothetical protein
MKYGLIIVAIKMPKLKWCYVAIDYSHQLNTLYKNIERKTNIFEIDDYHLLGDDNHHSHGRGNLKSYIFEINHHLAS